MRLVRFLARDAAEAAAQVRSRLGPGAVMVSLRPVPAGGLSRLWRRPLLEVRAHVPGEPAVPPPQPQSTPSAPAARPSGHTPPRRRKPPTRFPARPARLKRAALAKTARRARPNSASPAADGPPSEPAGPTPVPVPDVRPAPAPSPEAGLEAGPPGLGGRWQSAAVLCRMGLQPILVEKVLERVRAQHGPEPPAAFGEEMAMVRAALAGFWRPAPQESRKSTPIHAFIGPPGSGKTAVLCKWLAKAVLQERRRARVWRLDSRGPNFAGFLDFYAEVLGVEVEREWKGTVGLAGCEVAFVDLPGVPIADTSASEQLRAQLVRLHGVQTHLVLNAAYETPVLMAQARAFEDWPLSDLILTHVDEEKRLGKVWNLVLGTKFTVRFLAGGQNVPGEFVAAAPGRLIPQ